jgi:sigma-B regulation protein RsbU (phosphoserine phosphatase)
LFERTVQAGHERERLMALHQQAELARAGYERELNLAATIQANLFPAELPALAGYDLAARSRPARRCGGDYYDVIMVPDESGLALLCVADVSGKGLPASLLMSHMQATLRALLGRSRPLTALVSDASSLLYGSTAGNKYVTAAMLELDPASGVGRYVSAGHINSWLIDRDGAPRSLASTGAPLGLLPPGLIYDETEVVIAPGDCLVLCSDGVIDAQNLAEEEFGETRLAQAIADVRDRPAAEIVSHVIAAVDAFAASAPQFDDITLLVVRRKE